MLTTQLRNCTSPDRHIGHCDNPEDTPVLDKGSIGPVLSGGGASNLGGTQCSHHSGTDNAQQPTKGATFNGEQNPFNLTYFQRYFSDINIRLWVSIFVYHQSLCNTSYMHAFKVVVKYGKAEGGNPRCCSQKYKTQRLLHLLMCWNCFHLEATNRLELKFELRGLWL